MAGSEGGGPRPPPPLLAEEWPPLPDGAPEALDQEIAPEAEEPNGPSNAGNLPDLMHPNVVPSDEEGDRFPADVVPSADESDRKMLRSSSAPFVGPNGNAENGEQQNEVEEQEKPSEEPQSVVKRRIRQETGESNGSNARRLRQETGESLGSASRHMQRTESCEELPRSARRNNPIMKVHSEAPRQKLSPVEATRQILSSRSSRAGCSTDSCGSALTRGVASSQPSSFRSGIIGGCHSYASAHPSDYPFRTKLSELGTEFDRLSRDFTTAQAENTKLRQELRRLRLTITEREKEEQLPDESQGHKGQSSLELADMRQPGPREGKDQKMTMGRVLSMGGTLFGRMASEGPPVHAQRRGSANSGHFARFFAGRGGAAASVQPSRHSTSSLENPQFNHFSSGDDTGITSGEDGAIQFKVSPHDDFPASTALSSFNQPKDKPKHRGSKTSVASSSNKNWPFSLGSNPGSPESVGSAAEGQEQDEADEMVVQAQGSEHTFSGSGEAELESGAGGADAMVKHRSLKTIFKGISNLINTSAKASDDKDDKVDKGTVVEGRPYASIFPEYTEKGTKEERSVSLFPEYFSPSRDEDGVLNGVDSCHYSAYSMSTEYSEGGDMRKPVGILAPMGRCRMQWDFLALVCFMFEFWAIPFHVAFLHEFPEPMAVMMHCVTAVFFMDILLNFSTGYIENSSTVMLRAPIAWRYLRTWFLWDLLATVPFQLIAASFSLTRLIRILKLPRLLKTLRYVRIMPALEGLLLGRQTVSTEGSGFPGRCLLKYVVRMAAVLTTIALTAHVNGCVRWALLQCDRVPSAGERWPEDAGGDFYAALRCYYESFWWAYTALTIGRTEDSMGSAKIWAFEVVVASERLFFLALMGIWAVQEAMVYHESEARLQVLEENAMLYLKQHNISFKTRLQVLSSLDETRSSTELQRNFDTFVESFPEEVKRKIAEEMWSKKLLGLDLIKVIMEWQREFVKELAVIVREEIIATKTVVCHEGDASIAAYMVLRGELRIIVKFASAPIANFTQGMWVGEKALVNPGLRRSATVMAVTMSSLMAVPAERFQELLSRFNLRGKFEELCEEHLWKGLCGRCGSLGTHFSDACPHRGVGGFYAATRRTRMRFVIDRTMSMGTAGTSCEAASDEDTSEPILHRVSSRRTMKAVKTSAPLERTLTEFLKLHNLHRLVPVCHRLNITSLAALEDADWKELKEQEELTEEEKAQLTQEAFEDFRDRIKKAGRGVIRKGPVHRTQHLLFLSHYKVEAGTEAALMRSEIEQLMSEDPCSLGRHFDVPVFLDSEDLTDLHILQERVTSSHNLVLLLTKDVFTRPWDHKVLAECGIPLEEVVQSLKIVLKRIAVTYSPHKSGVIRRAELQALLEEASLREEPQGHTPTLCHSTTMNTHG